MRPGHSTGQRQSEEAASAITSIALVLGQRHGVRRTCAAAGQEVAEIFCHTSGRTKSLFSAPTVGGTWCPGPMASCPHDSPCKSRCSLRGWIVARSWSNQVEGVIDASESQVVIDALQHDLEGSCEAEPTDLSVSAEAGCMPQPLVDSAGVFPQPHPAEAERGGPVRVQNRFSALVSTEVDGSGVEVFPMTDAAVQVFVEIPRRWPSRRVVLNGLESRDPGHAHDPFKIGSRMNL